MDCIKFFSLFWERSKFQFRIKLAFVVLCTHKAEDTNEGEGYSIFFFQFGVTFRMCWLHIVRRVSIWPMAPVYYIRSWNIEVSLEWEQTQKVNFSSRRMCAHTRKMFAAQRLKYRPIRETMLTCVNVATALNIAVIYF